jgi:hypothetical protein
MKKVFYLVSAFLCLAVISIKAQNVIFLHHSTGNNVYKEGKVAEWISSYNKSNTTSINITERAFPTKPWPWANYPYDYWKLWVDGSCNSDNPNIECIESLAANHDLIIFKHCFPGAHIQANSGNPDVSSEKHTLENYKEQYRALRSLFSKHPGTKFMVWTLVPLHRLATNPEEANRTNEFVQWVNNEWLMEDGKSHANILIFDFFNYVSELSENPSNGVRYCLKYDFERSHTERDSHPNLAANLYAGPIFAKAIVDACLKK